MENLDEILAVQGVDAVQIGRADLGVRLGTTSRSDAIRTLERDLAKRVVESGKALWIWEDFNDAPAAKEAAAAQISAGADVIFALLDAGFVGVEQAVTESGKDVLLINPIFPRCEEGENIVGVAYLSSGGLVDQIISDYEGDSLPTPDPKFYGVENQDIQRFELCEGYAEYQDLVDQTTEGINDGSITLPEGV